MFRRVFSLFAKVPVVGVLTLAMVLGVTSAAFAEGVTLPTTGVDIPGTVSATVTVLGAAVAAIILAYAAFKVIKIALRWFGRIGG